MIVGVISDTHDKIPQIKKALEIFYVQNVEKIIHCGDWTLPSTVVSFGEEAARYSLPVYSVLGNRDVQREEIYKANHDLHAPIHFADSDTLIFTVDGLSCAVYHGHHKPTLTRLLADQTIDVLFTGHTHKPKIEKIEQKVLINPGSTAFSIPRSKNFRSTVAIFDTREKKLDLYPLQHKE